MARREKRKSVKKTKKSSTITARYSTKTGTWDTGRTISDNIPVSWEPPKTYTHTYYIPYKKDGEFAKKYVKNLAQQDRSTGRLTTRTIPNGAWIDWHANGTRVVAFWTENEAKEFMAYYWELTGIEVITVTYGNLEHMKK
jgi:hypothetical protein